VLVPFLGHQMSDFAPLARYCTMRCLMPRRSGLPRAIGAAERLFARLMPISGERLASNVAIVPDASIFKSGRQLAAWLGLVPR
jgi:transposase